MEPRPSARLSERTRDARMGVRIYTHPACLAHDTGPGHAERPERLHAVIDALRCANPELEWLEAPLANRQQVLRVHSAKLVATVLDARPESVTALDPDTLLSPGSAEAALRAAGSVIAAVDAACSGDAVRSFCVIRPPGHHATADTAMGFCLFNNAAVGAAHALAAHGLGRVAVVDFDVHHGNGTQDIFEREPRVLYVSSHQAPLYPGTGSAQEQGAGNMHNMPLPPGTGGLRFRKVWEHALLPALDAFRPQLVLVSAGFDGHWRDPLAQWQLDISDYTWLTRKLVEIADRHAGARLVSMLEGGYDLEALRSCSVAHVQAMADVDTA